MPPRDLRMIDSIAVADGEVTFRWEDYRHGSQVRLMTLSAEEFSGACASTCCPKASSGSGSTAFWPRAVARTRSHAADKRSMPIHPPPVPAVPTGETSTRVALPPCPVCGGVMVAVERLSIRQLAVQALIVGLALDSS